MRCAAVYPVRCRAVYPICSESNQRKEVPAACELQTWEDEDKRLSFSTAEPIDELLVADFGTSSDEDVHENQGSDQLQEACSDQYTPAIGNNAHESVTENFKNFKSHTPLSLEFNSDSTAHQCASPSIDPSNDSSATATSKGTGTSKDTMGCCGPQGEDAYEFSLHVAERANQKSKELLRMASEALLDSGPSAKLASLSRTESCPRLGTCHTRKNYQRIASKKYQQSSMALSLNKPLILPSRRRTGPSNFTLDLSNDEKRLDSQVEHLENRCENLMRMLSKALENDDHLKMKP